MKNFILGLVVGIANLLPGISGGTIIFISGRYGSVISALADLFSFKLSKTEVKMLFELGAGVGASVVLLSKLIDFLFSNFPLHVTSFFVGLIIGGLVYMYPSIGRLNLKRSLSLSAGVLLMSGIYLASEGNLSANFMTLFFGGGLAGATMILPGASGSSMLLLLGLYDDAIHAISEFEFFHLSALGLGAIVGIVLISVLMKKLVENYEHETMAFLYGLTLAGLIFIVTGGLSVSFVIFGLGTSFLLERVVGGEE